jgi:hypothetical protein
MSDVLVVIVLCAVGVLLAVSSSRLWRDAEARADYLETVRALRWWMLPTAIGHVVCLVAIVTLLLRAAPILGVGWWMLLGGVGNVALGQTGNTGGSWQILGLVVPLWIFFLVPILAHGEEITFRYGTERNSKARILRRQMVFGLGHAVFAGVPIAAGVALIGSGLLYQLVYVTSLNRLLDRTDLVVPTPEPARRDYPPPPAGPYDPAVWEAHHVEFDRVSEGNRVQLEEWFAETKQQRDERQAQLKSIRRIAASTAAALHTTCNWLIVGFLIGWLAINAIG